MNYQQLIKGLLAEAKNAERYKQMGPGVRVLTMIGLSPIFLFKWLVVIYYYALLFLYNALLSPANYLENWQSERTKGVQHITEAVVFLVSTPFIFFLRVWLSIASFFFYFLWFDLMCASYLFSLGSIRWQPFLNTATFDGTERHWKLKPAETGTMAFGIIAFSLFCVLTLLFNIWTFGEVYEVYDLMMVLNAIYYIQILIVNPILFRKTEMTEEEYKDYQQRATLAKQVYNGYGAPNFNQATYARPMNTSTPFNQAPQQNSFTQAPMGRPYTPQQNSFVQQNRAYTQAQQFQQPVQNDNGSDKIEP
jgi:hypothetical protein